MKRGVASYLNIVLRIIGISLVLSLVLSISWAAYYSKFDVRTTPQMISYEFKGKNDSVQLAVEYQWVPLDSISRNMVVAVLAAQDQNFYIHEGFAPINAFDTIIPVIPNRHETITQKTAHSVFLTSGDSWIKDILEPYYTVLEEYLWGKDRILEIYLNTVLFGNGIFGVEAASHIYFDKPASDLTIQEAALLAALLERPETIDIENPDEETSQRQKEIALVMGLMMHIKVGKKPIDEKETSPAKPIYRRKWRG